jgi:hypothetical protein
MTVLRYFAQHGPPNMSKFLKLFTQVTQTITCQNVILTVTAASFDSLTELEYTKKMAKMAFSRKDEVDDIQKTKRGIEMQKLPEGAPKG